MENTLITQYAAKYPQIASLDLAIEASSLLRGKENREIPGVSEQITNFTHGKATVIHIFNDEGAALMSRPQGKYITVEANAIRQGRLHEAELSAITAKQIKALLPENARNFLLIGLGNNKATPDSLGPKAVEYSIATRHILTESEELCNLHSLCTLAPGVLGITGIETAEIIKGVVERVQPDCIIAIDALAAAAMSRVCTTIQLTDTGINPGSGIGNKRLPINYETLGVPVIAIGVPTVVSGSVIIYEALQEYIGSAPAMEQFKQIEQSLLHSFDGHLIVTPKDIDNLSENIARILSAATAQAIHPGVNQHNYLQYIN